MQMPQSIIEICANKVEATEPSTQIKCLSWRFVLQYLASLSAYLRKKLKKNELNIRYFKIIIIYLKIKALIYKFIWKHLFPNKILTYD